MNRAAQVAAGSAALAAALLAAGCRSIPEDASVADFCETGEAFSASTDFSSGVAAAEELAKVGTPADIDAAARAGFEELIDRVTGAKDGADFKKTTAALTDAERDHLEALTVYIRKTCEIG